ncbi:substrate-binding domain-containing protein [Sansalvadorimonas sp. 2012CJ34-2]|uniref:Substrate-binding domain-containing protein n=2 Tax=Parendozoicomonas callyspongiae TaxID=2942213 RepID=A0ABT0PGQ3_9GAMM|nr:substrate-binding domain-containing protein [Sansalvadorimonas sp. 2012CJ34-2]
MTGTAAACEELGYRVGVDISIAGYGDYELGRYGKPAITTIRYETHQVGEQMAMMMLNKLEKKKFPGEKLVSDNNCRPPVRWAYCLLRKP